MKTDSYCVIVPLLEELFKTLFRYVINSKKTIILNINNNNLSYYFCVTGFALVALLLPL